LHEGESTPGLYLRKDPLIQAIQHLCLGLLLRFDIGQILPDYGAVKQGHDQEKDKQQNHTSLHDNPLGCYKIPLI